MVSGEVLQTQFLKRILERDQRFILSEQKKVLSANYKEITGRLMRNISSHPVTVNVNSSGAIMIFSYYMYIRFLDIKSNNKNRANLGLYNRIIWGRLYNETITDIRAGYNEQIEEIIYNQLKESSNG